MEELELYMVHKKFGVMPIDGGYYDQNPLLWYWWNEIYGLESEFAPDGPPGRQPDQGSILG